MSLSRRLCVLLKSALVLIAALVALLPASAASATPLPAAETRVGAFHHAETQVIGVAQHIAAGQHRVRGPSQLQIASGNCLAANTAGRADDLVGPSVRYDRTTQYGGAQTNNPAAQALRETAEGTACPSCGRPQTSGTSTAPVPEHSPSLLEHYYSGGHAMTDAQRVAYARSAEAFDGTLCLTCQRSQGGSLSHLSRWYAELWGL